MANGYSYYPPPLYAYNNGAYYDASVVDMPTTTDALGYNTSTIGNFSMGLSTYSDGTQQSVGSTSDHYQQHCNPQAHPNAIPTAEPFLAAPTDQHLDFANSEATTAYSDALPPAQPAILSGENTPSPQFHHNASAPYAHQSLQAFPAEEGIVSNASGGAGVSNPYNVHQGAPGWTEQPIEHSHPVGKNGGYSRDCDDDGKEPALGA
ncbi:hypothetical protein M408DRAFT_331561 [Serendipita vermifera MAFF 305830]|uniref:Uncharacterized protein n=1 Tax=Serendipita vermifera MAFF 305830 TaxID=933852 RepID=A0A0C3AY32_SERVB|nr:hypothetical protein M408DRAFT_331561 [Serendipita vermifera MAFF 305830]